ncbi:MAG: DEAD/DEAH box helicase [Patescibacteria group bacterium]
MQRGFSRDGGFQRNRRPSSRPRFGQNSSGPSSETQNGFRRPSSGRPKNNRGEKIDISRFIQKASGVSQGEKIEIVNAFADFALSDILKANLAKRNYTKPTPIQDQAINPIVEGRDLIGLANTGTGKTAAFLLPLIDKVSKNKREKVLVIAPTRELAIQIENEFRQFSWGMQLFSAICTGGAPIFKQISNLKRNPNFVIGTPGRLKDLSERGLIKFETFGTIVLDEVDRMLDMGFVDEIKRILKQLPENRQSLFFSATMPDKIRDLVRDFSRDAVTVAVKSGDTTANVEQDIVRVREKSYKFNQLQEILMGPEMKKVLIFIETKHEVDKLTTNLSKEGFKAECIHGNKRQNQRQKALTMFKNDAINILVATDVAARGLDIKDITHVINYTVPQTYDDYIHRIGRTGRGDKKGKALTFVEAR